MKPQARISRRQRKLKVFFVAMERSRRSANLARARHALLAAQGEMDAELAGPVPSAEHSMAVARRFVAALDRLERAFAGVAAAEAASAA